MNEKPDELVIMDDMIEGDPPAVRGTTDVEQWHAGAYRAEVHQSPWIPDLYAQVQRFNNKVVGPSVDRTSMGLNVPPHTDLLLAARIFYEEVRETLDAVCIVIPDFDEVAMFRPNTDVNHEEAADGSADVIYTLFGLLLRLGINRNQFYRVWAEVTRANMDKADGPLRADGKRLKPEGWRPPDIHGALHPHAEPGEGGAS